MLFGAEVEAGSVRFQLWAPAARRVEVCLAGGACRPLAAEDGGWHRAGVAGATPGVRYRYRIDGETLVPDPASRYQPEDVHGPSEVVDPDAFVWTDGRWTGRDREELVFYELHVGTFTPDGTFRAVVHRLDHLADLGVTAVELMPVADFPGRWSWGYDGVLPFAPDSSYGRPEDLKALVQACHARGLAVLLDVVYNHFGPEGNYLGLYAPQFFSARHRTPWGAAINLDGPGSDTVRAFFRDNALFWLEEYHLDGLRLDAVHALVDESPTHFLEELGRAVADGPGRNRPVHLVLENDGNETRYLRADRARRRLNVAQSNDDIHHALHVLVTDERDGYYADYADPVAALARCLSEGFAYQGERSHYRGRPRGESTVGVPLTAFVSFLQNHDQIGNRALGERLRALATPYALEAVTALLLLAPSPPLLFMGQEWNADEPFLFFCDFGPDLAARVREGRRAEFAHFPAFREARHRATIPDPNDEATFRRSQLDWSSLDHPEPRRWLAMTRDLLHLRRREIVPRLRGRAGTPGTSTRVGPSGLVVEWLLEDGETLTLLANLGSTPQPAPSRTGRGGRRLFGPPEPTGEDIWGAWFVAYDLAGGPP
jgi:malto-oligosyltrehalose trehalohydrolase